ncbi:hypothetical protein CL617_01830 [archaeon]|nr:hypothetical protein [archaeon]|tara:strand:- start:13695 stop:14132 length:438 start_codon:yes stop_codon:yes gene_type:complete
MIDESKEELKRADHLLYVTLKYTRTADVIKNTIHRLLTAFDNAIIHSLEILKEKKKIKELPLTPISRAELLRKTYKRPEMREFLDFYFTLKKIDRSDFSKREEYRKNVALVIESGNEVLLVDTVTLTEYFYKTKDFVQYISEKFK